MIAIQFAPVRHYASIDSTNLEAQRLAAAGLHTLTWLVADQQTAGIGRENRKWVSERGNLFVTLLLPIKVDIAKSPQLSLVAAVALFDSLAQFVDHTLIRIKWPNDILIEGRKVSGILVQSIHAAPQTFAIGMGVNVAYAPPNMPYPVTSLSDYTTTSPQVVLTALRGTLANALTIWNNGEGFAVIRQLWLDRAKCLGQAVRLSNGNDSILGTFVDMADDGALIIAQPDGSRTVAYVGDVKFLESEIQ